MVQCRSRPLALLKEADRLPGEATGSQIVRLGPTAVAVFGSSVIARVQSAAGPACVLSALTFAVTIQRPFGSG